MTDNSRTTERVEQEMGTLPRISQQTESGFMTLFGELAVQYLVTRLLSQKTWACFHCGETFTDEAEARLHFGARSNGDVEDVTACQLTRDDVESIRGMQAEVDERDAENLSLRTENARLVAALAEQEQQLQACAVFLKDGESVVECIVRNRADVDAILTLLAQAKHEKEAAEAQLAESDEGWEKAEGELAIEQSLRQVAEAQLAEQDARLSVLTQDVKTLRGLVVAGCDDLASNASALRAVEALKKKFIEYRDAPMKGGNQAEVRGIRKTLNVVVCELETVLAPPPVAQEGPA